MADKYKILSPLGGGGQAKVYLAKREHSRRKVALKRYVMLEHERFEREAELLSGISHPNIVSLLGYEVEDYGSYLVMDYLPRGSLKDWIEKSGPLSPLQSIPLLDQVARAVDYLHTKQIIHRDLKPSNILFDRWGRPILVDFGIAKKLGSSRLTLTGENLGTPGSMSPEQEAGDPDVNKPADIYALGSLLFQMLTGTLPCGETNLKDCEDVQQTALSDDIQQVILTAMATKEEDRYQTAAALASAFRAAVNPSITWRVTYWLRTTWRVGIARAALVVLGVLVMLIIFTQVSARGATIRQVNGVSMVEVPATCLFIGNNNSDSNVSTAFQACLPSFWIDQYKVTNEQFRRITGQIPHSRSCIENSWEFCAQRPVENVTWFEARDFCAQRGARLPSELEWEETARGPSDYNYPWGNEYYPEKADNKGQKLGPGTIPAPGTVQDYAEGRSWISVYNLLGEVQEWTGTVYRAYPYLPSDDQETVASTTAERVVRGSSWVDEPAATLTAYRRKGMLPTSRTYLVGFRCASAL